METIEFVIMHILYVVCISIFVTLWYRKRKDYIGLQSENKDLRESRDSFYELAHARMKTNDDLSRKIAELKKRINSMPMQPYNVTRIESYQQPIKDIRHVVEINPYDFSRMSDAEIEDMVKKEVLKHIFEAAEPLVEIVIEDCPMEASRKFMGRLKVVEPYKKEEK